MIAMQYGFTLPADYDMTIIDRRIREKGPMLDGFPDLRFKAYLSARKEGALPSAENLYAPFYLWQADAGIDRFLSGPGFAQLTRDFGWPVVRTWVVWHAELGERLADARYACRTIQPISAHADLQVMREAAIAEAPTGNAQGALAAVSGFDPTSWSMVHFQLWPTLPEQTAPDAQLYSVGHMSLPQDGSA
ncbi:DUF4865 domain-containing protein [Xaviernesmea oryzae]|uniref:DUF4865 domain-containing protein n=1 Tax=Xaviernesmea oryzae TaxID=464029 RepID=A0A1Q9B1T0_9HYPH|nr:DUF4865 family protein [Xaviernesmea oryzae]OLP61975.1 DUF4865 domain-containing protein [Xaviernesmea oryzae]SEK98794.1 protein of unknown function [Xaviernesmea oryzae]